MDQTPRLGLPLLSAGQMQKEEWHNEALLLLDLLSSGRIDGAVRSAPPASPEVGVFHRLAAAPSGAWAGHGGELAVQTAAGWRFVVPFEGLRLTDRAGGAQWLFASGAWQAGTLAGSRVEIDGTKVVGAQAGAITDPAAGTTVDAEARAAISAMLAALRQHGLIET